MNVAGVFSGAKKTVEAFFDIIDCQYWDELLINDMDTIRDISVHPELLDAAYRKGFALGELVRKSG
jgi:hypothetical protein